MSDPVVSLNAALEGRYRIQRQLGEGGMATVYLADDLRHERKVALKVLKPELAAVVGAERFLAEIKTTANLQHPHILPLFDSGEADSFLFYVMPYVQGESLRERLDREHQLPVDEAVQLARNVAEALDYAHGEGVVHRDIKPANILLQAGKPVVSDFGIALALGVAGAGRLTETGLSLGTPHYMSPEQATGDLGVGPAADIYALGCVLYEMLVGEPPYTGSTAQAILGKIVTGEAEDVTKHRKSVPPHVAAAIHKALEKVPADRFGTGRSLANALGNPEFKYGVSAALAEPGTGSARSRRRAVVAASAAGALGLALGWVLARPELPEARPPAVRLLLSTEGWAGVDVEVGRYSALAPNGSSMVLPLDGQLGLKMSNSTEVTPIPGTEGARDVVYSPDGQSIAYAVAADLYRRPLVGGAPTRLARDAQPTNRLGLTWLDDGTILYERSNGVAGLEVVQIPEVGGEPRTLLEGSVWWLHGLPRSRGALAVLQGGQLVLLNLEDASSEVLVEDALRAWYASTGHLVYLRNDGAVVGIPFDLETLRTSGASFAIFEGVRAASNQGDMHLAPDGTVLYVPGGSFSGGATDEFVWVTRDGTPEAVQPGETFQFTGGPNASMSLSPSGDRVAFTRGDTGGGDIYVKDLPNGVPSRLTFSEGADFGPSWTPNGEVITFLSDRPMALDTSSLPRVWSRRADGAGAAEPVFGGTPVAEAVWSPNGEWLVMRGTEGPATVGSRDILGIRPERDTTATPLVVTPSVEHGPAISRDGRWLAYSAENPGGHQIFVRPFPESGTGAYWQISFDGGIRPVWAHNGRELFFISPSSRELMVAEFDGGGATFQRTSLAPLFSIPSGVYAAGNSGGASVYDVSPDDQRFLMVRDGGLGAITTERASFVVLIQNFFSELAQYEAN